MSRVKRQLIVNADDLGMSPSVNRGIERAHVEGIVTSASLMVRRAGAFEAARLAARNPSLGVGLHVDLGDWAFRDGRWWLVEQVVSLEDSVAVEDEIVGQVARFHHLIGRAPTHLDSHQHVHMESPIREAAERAAARMGVPLRGLSTDVRFCGDFYGQSGHGDPMPELITVEALIALLAGLPAGLTELGCHPGERGTDDLYGVERVLELQTLTDPRVLQVVRTEGLELVSHDPSRGVRVGGGTHAVKALA